MPQLRALHDVGHDSGPKEPDLVGDSTASGVSVTEGGARGLGRTGGILSRKDRLQVPLVSSCATLTHKQRCSRRFPARVVVVLLHDRLYWSPEDRPRVCAASGVSYNLAFHSSTRILLSSTHFAIRCFHRPTRSSA